ncbi:SLC13 family permease [Dyella mobilis]|uniref:Citrate transporter n=1 Tax=Dyella mobilis TaxID=1849582 RepID=A0ABS2KLW5_9GAMM|nr:SLC13 family permease [Dyella mobilis]MBM7132137.1 citrate transporter [Dyella mobilis]GLQ95878.1 membrane protein [Dyella mobilis]
MPISGGQSRKTTSTWRNRLKREWLLGLFAVIALILAAIDPQPMARYQQWLQWPTLCGLLGLLIAIQGIRDSGLVQHVAGALVARVHTLRGVGLLLVSMTAVLSTVLTNDVSLFLVVPLTVAIAGMSNLPALRMAILEALAVNAGSTLSPIGNPQNLLIWQHAQVPFLHFVGAMAPTTVVMFVLVAALTWCWLPRDRVQLQAERLDGHRISAWLATLSLAGLAVMVLMMEYGRAPLGALLLVLAFAFFSTRSLARIDWFLMATFAAIFLGLGHFAALPAIGRLLDGIAFDRPWALYLSGIASSQLISNVPATVLLLDRAPNAMALAVAVNVGGFGVAIGSLANLIALRLAKQPGAMRLFHQVSIPFLLICAPLVYLVTRLLA